MLDETIIKQINSPNMLEIMCVYFYTVFLSPSPPLLVSIISKYEKIDVYCNMNNIFNLTYVVIISNSVE